MIILSWYISGLYSGPFKAYYKDSRREDERKYPIVSQGDITLSFFTSECQSEEPLRSPRMIAQG